MENKVYAIIGGFDQLSSSVYDSACKINNKSIFINVSSIKIKKKNIYNFKIYELEKIINFLKDKNVTNLCITGKVSRPNIDSIKVDKVLSLHMSVIMSAYKRGDDNLLKTIANIFISYDFNIVSIKKINKNFYFNNNYECSSDLSKQDFLDIKKGTSILNAISNFDNAQSIIVSNGYILGIEAVEGSDKLIKRVVAEKKILNLIMPQGFLIKLPKKNQIMNIDPPVIGPKTIKLISKCNLNGIAIDKNRTVIFQQEKVIQILRDKHLKMYFI